MGEEKKEHHYEREDATRHVIRSHSTMIVSIPQEIAMRAGLQRGVDVRVDQDPENPTIITVEVVNPADQSKDLGELLAERRRRADKIAAGIKEAAEAKRAAKKKDAEKPEEVAAR